VSRAGSSVDAAVSRRIATLLADCAHAVDDGEFERWPGFFTEDGVYRVLTRENHEAGLPMAIMSCEGRGMMADRVMALRTANIFEPHSYCHLLGPTVCVGGPDGPISARTNFTVVRTMQDGAMTLFAAGKYLDEIIVADSRPLLRRRDVVLESRRIDVLLVYPL
jgi:anthranilate 1,2-dioxygenase small subunit